MSSIRASIRLKFGTSRMLRIGEEGSSFWQIISFRGGK